MKASLFLLVALGVSPCFAALPREVSYVVSTMIVLASAGLVMWMAAGFCMLEAGLVRSKNTAVICLKNLLIYAISCIAFYLIGYNLMFVDVTGWLGSLVPFANVGASEFSLVSGGEGSHLLGDILEGNSTSSAALVFFQMTFVATAASVVSGTVAERVRLWPFFILVAIMAAFIYPITGAWTWGGGWLAEMGFYDFAGSTVVHSVGGWAALAGAFLLGPRKDKYNSDGSVKNYFPLQRPFGDPWSLCALVWLVRL